MNKGNVLLINDKQIGGGAETSLRLEKELLKELGFQVFTVTFDDGDIEEENAFVLKPSRRKEKVVKFFGSKDLLNQLDDVLIQIDPIFIHLHLVSKYPLVVYKSLKLQSFKVIQTLHGPNLFCASGWGGLKNGGGCELGIGIKCFSRNCVTLPVSLLYTQLINRYLEDVKNAVDVFLCPSLNILNTAKKFGFANNIFIPNCIDDQFLETPKKWKSKRPTILFAGALEKQKGAHLLIPIMLEIIKIYPDALMKIAGTGALNDEILRNIRVHKVEYNFELMGFIDSERIRSFYGSGDVFLMPSLWHEQFGLVGPEALSCRVPVVATNIGGIGEWLSNGENGYLVAPSDIETFARRVVDILKDDVLRKNMGNLGRNKVIQNYSSVQFKENLKGILKNLIDE